MVVAIACLRSSPTSEGGRTSSGELDRQAYLLAYVVAMPLAGRGAGPVGTLRLYVVALLLFVIGSAVSRAVSGRGPEDGLTWLIVARVVQGSAARRARPAVEALARHLFRRARAWHCTRRRRRARHLHGMAIGTAYGHGFPERFAADPRPRDPRRGSGSSCSTLPIGIVTLLLIYVFAGGVEGRLGSASAGPCWRRAADRRPRGGIGAISVSGEVGLDRPARHRRTPARCGRGAVFVWPSCERAGRSSTCAFSPIGHFSPPTSSACLTGYTLATAVIGGPVFVNRGPLRVPMRSRRPL